MSRSFESLASYFAFFDFGSYNLAGLGEPGLANALVLTRLMASLLYRLEATDPLTFLATSLALRAVAAAAGYLPALRASRVDPMSALRTT